MVRGRRKKSSARKVDTARLAASRNVCHPTQDIKQGQRNDNMKEGKNANDQENMAELE